MKSPPTDTPPNLETKVGRDPDDLATSITLRADAFGAGCYVAGNVPDQQTALLHDWCVQWANAGLGFCYIHPRGPAPRDLLARLPDDRLDDVVWIDFRRSTLPEQLEVPQLQRVAIDPFETPTSEVDAADLVTEPIAARCSDCLEAVSTHEQFDWNVARILTTVLPWLVSDEDLATVDVTKALDRAGWDASGMGIEWNESEHTIEPVLDLAPDDDATARSQLEHAQAHDSDALSTAARLLRVPFDPFPDNPLFYETTYEVHEAIPNNRIVLISGALPPADGPLPQSGIDLLGIHLLVGAVVRRLWEALQSRAATDPMYPLVLDRATELVPGEGTWLQELLAHGPETPLALLMNGKPVSHLPEPARIAVAEHVDTRVIFAEQVTVDVRRELQAGDLAALERYLEVEQTGHVGDGPLCWVRTGTAGSLTANPRTKTHSRPALPPDPPPRVQSRDELVQAITTSVERYGAEPTWLTDEMKADVRSE